MANGVTKLAIPRIGCGLDGLIWDKVKAQIHEIFDGEPIEIVVYNYSAAAKWFVFEWHLKFC